MPTTAFKWKLTVNGDYIKHFGGMEISVSADGAGTSGVYSAEFTFSVPLAEHPYYNTEFEGGSPVYLYRDYGYSENASQTFYISSKSADGTSIRIKCYDRMTFTEADFPCSDDDFYDSDGNETGMRFISVMQRICSECGFAAYISNSDSVFENVPPLTKNLLIGKTCRDILAELSKVFCGYWCCRSRGEASVLSFVPFGTDAGSLDAKYLTSDKHEKLMPTTRVLINNVYMKSNSKSFGSPGGTETIRIESALVSERAWLEVNSRAAVLYTGFGCSNAFLDDLPELPLAVSFGGEDDISLVNYCTAKISSRGILASLGRNSIDEGKWTYRNRSRREIEKRYSEGDIWKNVEITKNDGLRTVFSDDDDNKTKYSFEMLAGGVTVYEGNMTALVPAERITPTFDSNDDSVVRSVEYFTGDVRNVMEFEWDGDTIKYYKRSRYYIDPATERPRLIFEDEIKE